MADTQIAKSHRIVVGVDGSPCSIHALEWAIRQARMTGARVVVVAAWHLPVQIWWGIALPPAHSPPDYAESAVAEVLDPIRKEHPDVVIESMVVEGRPARALVEASIGSDLLVVGSRGHGEFAGMLLGSVSEHCASNAKCPVLVFREE